MNEVKNIAFELRKYLNELSELGFRRSDILDIVNNHSFPDASNVAVAEPKKSFQDHIHDIEFLKQLLISKKHHIIIFNSEIKVVLHSEEINSLIKDQNFSILDRNLSEIIFDSKSLLAIKEFVNNPINDSVSINHCILKFNKVLHYASIEVSKISCNSNKYIQIIFELNSSEVENDKLTEIYDNLLSMINATTETAVLTDFEGLVLETNQVFADRLNKLKDEIIGKCLFDFFDEETSLRRKEYFYKTVNQAQSISYHDERNSRKYKVSQHPILNKKGKVCKVAIFAQDITIETQYSKDLRERENYFRQFAEMLPQTVFQTNLKREITFSNLNGLKMFGYTLEDLKNGLNVYNLIHEDERLLVRKYVDEYAKKQGNFNFKCNAVKKDGAVFPVSVFANTMYSNGEFIGFIGIVIDDSKYHDLEIDLKLSRDRFTMLNDTKNKLFSILAHDLRGPFSGFINLTETISRKFEDIKVHDLKEISSSLHSSAINLYRLLDNLLSWAMSQSGNIKANFIYMDLKIIINEILEYFHLNIKQKNINVKLSVPNNFDIYADKDMIKTALRNLISNAIKYSNIGGIIEISVYQENNQSVFEIKDYGIGIPPEKLDLIFKVNDIEFTEGTMNEPGTGLGLAITKEFIQLNNGDLVVESQVDKGSTFKIIFK